MASRSTRKLPSGAEPNASPSSNKRKATSPVPDPQRILMLREQLRMSVSNARQQAMENSEEIRQGYQEFTTLEDQRLKNYAAEERRRIDKESKEYRANKMTLAEKEVEDYKAESMARIDKQLGEYEVEKRVEKCVNESMDRIDEKFESFKAEVVEDMSKVVNESNQRFKEMLAGVEKTMEDILNEKRDETWNPTKERFDKVFRDLMSCVFLMGVAGTPSGDIMSQIRESLDKVNVDTDFARSLMNEMVGFLRPADIGGGQMPDV